MSSPRGSLVARQGGRPPALLPCRPRCYLSKSGSFMLKSRNLIWSQSAEGLSKTVPAYTHPWDDSGSLKKTSLCTGVSSVCEWVG